MSHDYDISARNSSAAAGGHDATGELVSRLSQDVSRLVRDELRLAQVEVTGKAKKAGIGAGMLGAAGVLALFGVGVLVTSAILAIALAVNAWLAALIVGVVLLAAAGIVALVGKKSVTQAAPPMPERAVENVKCDVDAVKHAPNPDRPLAVPAA